MLYYLTLLGILLTSILTGALLEESVESLQGKKIGCYIGSFDPIHLGHQHVVEEALKYVDYLLIYPAPGGDSFKNRTALDIRQRMIEAIYQQHPRVLFTRWSPKELQENLKMDVIGVIGSDVVLDQIGNDKYNRVFMRGIPLTEKHYHDTIGALMALKADSFLVTLRGDVRLDDKVRDRPVLAFIQSDTTSSTEVRNAVKEKGAFEHLLAFTTQAIIKQEGLYGYATSFDKALQKELLEMQERDEAARTKAPLDWDEIGKIDAEHGKRLREIVKEHGWPGVSLVGFEGTSAMWLLVQHQDEATEFQKECLELLKNAVEAHESPMKNLAYLTDRVRMHEGIPQVYGTQWFLEEGACRMHPVEDEENLDKRRHEAGLCPLDEYRKLIEQFI